MCTASAPRIQTNPEPNNKPVQYLSNPWVDGLGMAGATARGRNSLRIDTNVPRTSVNIRPPAGVAPVAQLVKPPSRSAERPFSQGLTIPN